MLVGDSFPTDQHYMQNPDELFTKPNCALQVDLENMLVREGHIQCAAYEMPIRPEQDAQYFGKDIPTICEERLASAREDSARARDDHFVQLAKRDRKLADCIAKVCNHQLRSTLRLY